MGERLLCTQKVNGSTPLSSTYAGVAERGVYNLETCLIRSGGVTEKDTVKVTNPSSGTFIWTCSSDG